jgi:hypothetical protein
MKPDHDELATRFADTLIRAGWNRYYGNRRTWTSWCRPDGTRANALDTMRFLLIAHPDAYYLSNYTMRKMARYADQLPAQRSLSGAA